MTRPLSTGKQSVDLGSPGARPSRIRRDPPPPAREKLVVNPDERDQRVVILGVLSFALAIAVIVFAFGSYSGLSLEHHVIEL